MAVNNPSFFIFLKSLRPPSISLAFCLLRYAGPIHLFSNFYVPQASLVLDADSLLYISGTRLSLAAALQDRWILLHLPISQLLIVTLFGVGQLMPTGSGGRHYT